MTRLDLRSAARTLSRFPTTTLAVVVVMGLGVGAATTIFTLVNSVLLRPSPYVEGDRILHLRTREEGGGATRVSYPDFQDFRAGASSLDVVAAAGPLRLVLTGQNAGVEAVVGEYVSPDYFELFGMPAGLGRTFVADEPDRSIILSQGLWKRRYGADREILGTNISSTVGPFVVVGVMPQRFGGLTDEVCLLCSDVDFWIPASASRLVYDGFLEDRGRRWHYVAARLAPNESIAAARSETTAIALRLELAYPDTNRGLSASLSPLAENWRANARPGLVLLLLGALLLLLIGNTNVAHLLLALGARRFRETAVRASLGSGRWRLVTQSLFESLLFALGGASFGMLLASWLSRALATLSGRGLPTFVDYSMDWRVLGFALALSGVSAIVAGVVPAIRASKVDLTEALKGTSRSSSVTGGRFTKVLLASQMALVVVLLVHALLLVRSYQNLEAADPGFDHEDLLVFEVNPSGPQYRHPDALRSFVTRLQSELQALPGGERIAIAAPNLPPRTFVELDVFPEGRGLDSPEGSLAVETHRVTPNFFEMLDVPVVAGRGFDTRDTRSSPVSAVVSASLAEHFWPGENPLGQRIREREPRFAPDGMTVIGVVSDLKYGGIRSERGREHDLYLSLNQANASYLTIAARTEGDADAMRSAVRGVLAMLDPELPILVTATVEERFAREHADTALQSTVLVGFGLAALIIAGVGIFGVASHTVVARTREIGIRMAVGGAPQDIVRGEVSRNMRPILVGLAIGLVASFFLTRLASSILFGVGPWDGVSFLSAFGLLLVAALSASYVPAMRAAALEPVQALRRD